MPLRLIVAAASGILLWTVAGTVPPAHAEDPERTLRTQHFAVTWYDDSSHPDAPDLSDVDDSGIPDAVERLGAAFEEARSFLVGDSGYEPPPVEGLYPIYVLQGSVFAETRVGPGGEGRSRPSFILVSPAGMAPSRSSDDVLRTAAHEYFHAIQLGYDAREDSWIREASAAWVEDVITGGSGSNAGYLTWFLPHPRESLLEPGPRSYGAFLFLQFLVERYGDTSDVGAVRELWEDMAVDAAIAGAPDLDSTAAVSAFLARRGATLQEAWGEFLLWQRQLRRFEHGSTYRGAVGRGVPPPLRTTTVGRESCRLEVASAGAPLPPLSGDYFRLRPGRRASGTALLTARGTPDAGGFAVVRRKGQPAQVRDLLFDENGVAQVEVPFTKGATKAVLAGAGNAAPSDAMALDYSIRFPDRSRVAIAQPTAPGTSTYGIGFFLRGAVTCGGAPASSADVEVSATERHSGVTTHLRTTTKADGTWTLPVHPEVNVVYRASVVDPLLSSAASQDTHVGVAPFVSLEARDEVGLGDPLSVTSVVTPAHPGAGMVIEFRRPLAAQWRLAGEAARDPDGSYTFDLTLPSDGVWEVRARLTSTGDDDHVPGRSSPHQVWVRES